MFGHNANKGLHERVVRQMLSFLKHIWMSPTALTSFIAVSLSSVERCDLSFHLVFKPQTWNILTLEQRSKFE